MDITFSPKVAICSSNNFNNDEFLSNVNSALADLDFLTDDPPPPIPADLMYQPPFFKIKKMASKIGNILEGAKSEKSLKDSEVLSSFINFDFDFSTNYQIKSHEIEPLRTVFDFISKNRKNVHFASPIYPANDILVVASVMTPKSSNNELKRQVHQCFAALGSNTLQQLIGKIVCPICKITEVTAGPHCVPDQFEIDGKVYYNFNKGFDKTLSQILTKINCCGNYKSKGGCTHFIVFNGAFAVNVDSPPIDIPRTHPFTLPQINKENSNSDNDNNNNDNAGEDDDQQGSYENSKYFIDEEENSKSFNDGNELHSGSITNNQFNQFGNFSFPVEIAGKGANPPICYICKIRPGFIIVKDESFISTSESSSLKIDEEEADEEEELIEEFPFRFFCSKCFDEAVFDKEKAIIINLSDHFFIPAT